MPDLEQFIMQSVALPYSDIQLPIVRAYAVTPTTLAKCVPVLYLYGQAGSGKSTLARLLAHYHDTVPIAASTTFAAVRNTINKIRWDSVGFEEGSPVFEGEKDYCLILDNLNERTLKDENYYSLFLNGYHRSTDTYYISKGDGDNLEFRVFGKKVVSSVHYTFGGLGMGELARRALPIHTERLDKQSGDARCTYLTDLDHADLDSLDLDSMSPRHCHEYMTAEDRNAFLAARKAINNFKPKSLSNAQWTICRDLASAGMAKDIWGTPSEMRDNLGAYWDLINKLHGNSKDVALMLAETFIDKLGSPKELEPEIISDFFRQCRTKGLCDNLRQKDLQRLLLDLGYTLQTIQGTLTYVRT